MSWTVLQITKIAKLLAVPSLRVHDTGSYEPQMSKPAEERPGFFFKIFYPTVFYSATTIYQGHLKLANLITL